MKAPTYNVSEDKLFFFSNLALTERNMQLKFDLKLSVYSLGLEIWPLFFEFIRMASKASNRNGAKKLMK